MKQIKLVIGVLLLAGLMAMPTPAFSGTIAGNTTATTTAAYEVLGSALSNNVQAVIFTPTTALTTSEILNISLSGAATFNTSSTYLLCGNNSVGGAPNMVVSTGSPINGGTSLAMLIANLSNVGGYNLTLTSDPTCLGYTTTTEVGGNLAFVLPAGSPAGMTTISASLNSSGQTIETFNGVNLIRVVNQISSVLSAVDLVSIDYLSGPANGTTVAVVSGGSNVIGISPAKLQVNDTTTPSYPLPVQNMAVSVALTDSANWVGLRSAFLTLSSTSCTGSTNNGVAVNVPSSGVLTLAAPNNFPIGAAVSNNLTLCVTASGNTVLSPRTIYGAFTYTPVSSSYRAPSAGSNVPYQIWNTNAYQVFSPYVYMGGGAANAALPTANDVFVRFNNNSATAANVTVVVYAGSGAAPTAPIVLGTLPAYSSATYWGGDIGTAAGLTSGATFGAQFTVTAAPEMVTAVSYYKRSASGSGGDRPIPLLKDATLAAQASWATWTPIMDYQQE